MDSRGTHFFWGDLEMANGENMIMVGTTSTSLTALPAPYKYEWSLQRVSAGESGRSDDAVMHVNQVAQKRKIQLAWRTKTPTETSAILQAVNPEYIWVRYWDMLNAQYETRKFYTGDRSAPVSIWNTGKKIIETITVDIIEV